MMQSVENRIGRQDYIQKPIAIIGFSCRLPGHVDSPTALWRFLKNGDCAETKVPPSRFNLKGHYDRSRKAGTMRAPGGMFLEDVDIRDVDANFFGLNRERYPASKTTKLLADIHRLLTDSEAISMDPQQRQLLEVVYEGLENAGITLQAIRRKAVGCFVGSYASDYGDSQSRDPEDKVPNVTVGVGRAMLSNRISHFLDIHGPSMTIDTACSGSLVAVDVACRYLQTGEISLAIVAGCNLYLNPDHTMDHSMSGVISPTGRCHTFDAKADGYVKAEAVNCVILKRLDDAIGDRDAIRAVIRGTTTNCDGWTAGIASPSSTAQATAIREAHDKAGISDLSDTSYLECHGTGTPAGDPVEVKGVASALGQACSRQTPLRIGSIKSNIGHSEPAAGLSGLIKTVLAVENGLIPGNPTYETPNPQIDFAALNVMPSKFSSSWPRDAVRRACVNSFGYGGSNAVVVLEEARPHLCQGLTFHATSYATDDDDIFREQCVDRPHLLAFSANDEPSLKEYCHKITKHLINPAVDVRLPDLAFTLTERRTHHFHRGFCISRQPRLDESALVRGKVGAKSPTIAFVFTGQGAQWPQMGRAILDQFPFLESTVRKWDSLLQSLADRPKWSLLDKLTKPMKPEELQLPELSQPLTTTLQLLILELFRNWQIQPDFVIGHSSGEIAAATCAGRLTAEQALKVSFYRGKAMSAYQSHMTSPTGMLAVGMSAEVVQQHVCDLNVCIACVNSPESVTLSGLFSDLITVRDRLHAMGAFARLLHVDAAYHSHLVKDAAAEYKSLLLQNTDNHLMTSGNAIMLSTVTGSQWDGPCDADYWERNMVFPVKFSQAVELMIGKNHNDTLFIEIGPSNALAGSIAQILKSVGGPPSTEYRPALKRNIDAAQTLLGVAGQVYILGGQVNLSHVNRIEDNFSKPLLLTDLPNYAWNHSTKYWHESDASRDWRFRKFVRHDLLGSKVLGTSWHAPTWKNILRMQDLRWLKDHQIGNDIVFPAAGYLAMALEAIYQTTASTHDAAIDIRVKELDYKFRNVKFLRAMILSEKSSGTKIMLTLSRHQGSWYQFGIESLYGDEWTEHCKGLISASRNFAKDEDPGALETLAYSTLAKSWYETMQSVGYNFGPHFQTQIEVQSSANSRQNRALISLSPPQASAQESNYLIHPVCIDGCLQSGAPSLWAGLRDAVDALLIPAALDELTLFHNDNPPDTAVSIADAEYSGVGSAEFAKNYKSSASVRDRRTGALLLKFSGLSFFELETRGAFQHKSLYTMNHWKPDITFILHSDLKQSNSHKGDSLTKSPFGVAIELMLHKKNKSKVLEVNMGTLNESLWLNERPVDATAAGSSPRFHFCATDPSVWYKLQNRLDEQIEFAILDLTKSSSTFEFHERDFDIIIVQMPSSLREFLGNIAHNVRSLLNREGFLWLSIGENHSRISLERLDQESSEPLIMDRGDAPCALQSNGFEKILDFSSAALEPTEFFAAPRCILENAIALPDRNIYLTSLSPDTQIPQELLETLRSYGWQCSIVRPESMKSMTGKTFLVLDELYRPALTHIDKGGWLNLKRAMQPGNRILWVTSGAQFQVTDPSKALISGLMRTVCAETPELQIAVLDVESALGISTPGAVHRMLFRLQTLGPSESIEREFVERGGTIFVSRIYPDQELNVAVKTSVGNARSTSMPLFDTASCVRLVCPQPGSLESLCFKEVEARDFTLEDDSIEIEIFAAGLNFKDIATVMGLVPEEQYRLGLEGAGIVRRVGSKVEKFKVGQRVLAHGRGCFANRMQCFAQAVHLLPDSMSFEEAATLPCVWLVVLHTFLDLHVVQRRNRVLIHSAAGGVGIAAIQLCQHLGVEIYATVGSDEKKDFLIKHFSIPADHIFSSRSTEFGSKLMAATNGKGVDVILNSLTGDMLDESWHCIADGGTMVEIGKADILEHHVLSMEPFGRNASYRAIDMSHHSVSRAMTERLISILFQLIQGNHIKPLPPTKSFSFGEFPAAFRYFRQGGHIGKVVFSRLYEKDVLVSIRRDAPSLHLRKDAIYIVVGGLRGICGRMAVYLARHGARHLVVMSRTGSKSVDMKSEAAVRDLKALDVEVELFQGDVADPTAVKRMIRKQQRPIRGIIQGAMVLRDATFTSMTCSDFHEAIQAKVQGTWNLHNTTLEQNAPLDFFCMLSSISGVIGQKGQANYAAANAFLDSFATYRQTLGLPASSIDLGFVKDVGYINERPELARRLDMAAWIPIDERLLHQILQVSILQQVAPISTGSRSQMITGITVPQEKDSTLLEDARFSPLFYETELLQEVESGKTANGVHAFQALLEAKVDKQTLLAGILPFVNQLLMRSLNLSEPVEPAKPLNSYGIDSLAVVELRNGIRLEMDVEVTATEIGNAKSLSSLCEHIVDKLRPG